MRGLDYYMDGLLHEYLNQPDDEEEKKKAEEDDYFEIDDYYQGEDLC